MNPILTSNAELIEPLREAIRKETGHSLTATLNSHNNWEITSRSKLTPREAVKLENLVHGFILGWEAKNV